MFDNGYFYNTHNKLHGSVRNVTEVLRTTRV